MQEHWVEPAPDQQLPKGTSWELDDFKARPRVVRRFINSAIYVEKEVVDMPPMRKTSPLNLVEDFGESESSRREGDTKLRAATTARMSHYLCRITEEDMSPEKSKSDSSQDTAESGYKSSHSSERSGVTVATVRTAKVDSELRLSLSCLSNRTSCLDARERQEAVQNWMVKKQLEKKRKAESEAKEAKEKAKRRELLLQKERENFKKWLAEKKKEEERKRAMKELEAEEEKLREAEKERKKVQNAINFQMWLKRKRRDQLEKQISRKLDLLQICEDKQKRLECNERAYEQWLENSKFKQRPVPMNQGLKSLCSSSSVTYINPIPWNTNVESNLNQSFYQMNG